MIRNILFGSALQALALFSFAPSSALAAQLEANDWTKEVARAAGEGRCDDAKTIALRNGSIDLAERALKLCEPLKGQIAPGTSPSTSVLPPAPSIGLPSSRAKVAFDGQPVEKIEFNAKLKSATASITAMSLSYTPGLNIQKRPTGFEILRYYPADALKAKLAGFARVKCLVDRSGRPKNCVSTMEIPKETGFASAAVKAAALFKFEPLSSDENDVRDRPALISVTFLADFNSGLKFRPPIEISELDPEFFYEDAKNGDPSAQNNLGVMYEFGVGVDQDYSAARLWYEKAAIQGLKTAQANLGWIYERGLSVNQDYKRAAELYLLAADQGSAMAQVNLGIIKYKGLGVPRDVVAAANWFQRAADQNDATAKDNLRALCEAHSQITGCP